MTHRKSRLIGHIQARPRLFIAGALGLAVSWLLPHVWASREVTRLIIGWNTGAWLYLGLTGWMMVRSDQSQIARRSRVQDDGAMAILILVVLSSLASLGAIVAELSVARGLVGIDRLMHIALAVVTILASWAFTQVMFAMHYAHDYYASRARGQSGGLIFPETDGPDYLDFLYFAAVIGTSAQTADVSISSRAMRRVALLHCVQAFVFNTSLIALLINVASSLL
ncbi:MAG: DUF1345 domain-containing protein [Acidobacteriota bacterium]